MVTGIKQADRRRFDMRFGNRSSDSDAAHLLDAVQKAGEENMSRFTKDVLAALYTLWQERGGELPLTRESIVTFLGANGATQVEGVHSSYRSAEKFAIQPSRATRNGAGKSNVTFSSQKANAETVAKNFLSSMKDLASGFFD